MRTTQTSRPKGAMNLFLKLKLMALALCGLATTSAWGAAAPANDNFANASIISASNAPAPAGTISGNSVGATKEPTEPAHAGNQGGASVWYSWYAPFTGSVTFNTESSGFDTLLAAYTGQTVGALTPVAANDDVNFPADLTSQITFAVTQGTTYYIAVDGYGGASGPVVLTWRPVGANAAGTFGFASQFQDPQSGTPLYVESDAESVPRLNPNMPQFQRPVITIRRTAGSAGKVHVNFTVTNALYADNIIGLFYGTNIVTIPGNATAGPFTNTFITNFVPLDNPQDYVGVVSDTGNLSPISGFQNACSFTNQAGTNYIVQMVGTNLVSSNMTIIVSSNTPFPPFPIVMVTNFFTTNADLTTNFNVSIPFSFTTNGTQMRPAANDQFSQNFPQDFYSYSSSVDFIDYQMSADIVITNVINPYSRGFALDFLAPFGEGPIGRDPLILVTIDSVQLDPLESTNLVPPTIDATTGKAYVSSLNQESIGGGSLNSCLTTNTIFNFEHAHFRISRKNNMPRNNPAVTNRGGFAHIGVVRTGFDSTTGGTVKYRICALPIFDAHVNQDHSFNVMPNSEYATPGFTNLSTGNIDAFSGPGSTEPADFVSGISTDPAFGGLTGTLTFGQNDVVQFIDIPLLTNNLVEFNEDFIIQLLPFQQGSPQVGNIGTCVVTLTYDNEPAGAVDRGHNPSGSANTDPPFNSQPGADGPVYAVAVQPDGKAVFGGDFLAYNTKQQFRHVGRMNTDGSADLAFMAPPNAGANAVVTCLALGTNNTIYIGGNFTSFNGTNRFGIARLNGDGSLDASFNPGLGVNGSIRALVVQPADGKVLIAGDFTLENSTNRSRVARLNPDGSLDLTFDPGVGPNSTVNALAVQADGRILIGGAFTTVDGLSRNSIARLNTSGTLDTTFDPGVGADQPVYAVTVQQDGRILIGGAFSTYNLGNNNHLTRLNSDGSLDITFEPGSGPDDTVYTIVMNPDNTILLGGIFTSVNGTRRIGMARLLSNGWVDTSFMDTAFNQFAGFINHYADRDVEPKNFLFSMALQADGNIIVGGGFNQVGGGGSRDAINQRGNVTRILGGSTPGPGNIGLASSSYSADENGGNSFVNLTRQNGSLGPAQVTFSPVVKGVGPGIAQYGKDFTFNASAYGTPTWQNSAWGNNATWMFTPGESGLNSLLGNNAPSWAFIHVIEDNVLDGNQTLDVQVSQPNGTDLLFLGGEGGALGYGVDIPLGVALGSTRAPFTIVNDKSAHGTIGFSSVAYTVSENATNAVITVVRTNGTAGLVTVRYATANGTAVAGTTNDYLATSGQLNFGSGDTVKTFTVPIVDNGVVQPDHTVLLTLFNVTGGGSAGLTNAVLTIIDTDFAAGHLNFSTTNFTANEVDGLATITVTRTGGAAAALSVNYATSAGSAVNGINYNDTSGVLHWNTGDSAAKTFTVPVLHDGQVTSNLTVNLQIFNPVITNGVNPLVLGPLTNSTLTIINDDFYGSPAFSTPFYTVNNNGGSVHITVVREGGNAQTISVPFNTIDGTAVNGQDYNGVSGTLTFGPGVLVQGFDVPVIDQGVSNGPVFFTVQLGAPSPAGVTNNYPSVATVNIINSETFVQPPGGLDTTYDPTGFFNSNVYAVALQSDSKIVAGGDFTSVNSFVRNRIARLNADGTLDVKFSSATEGADGSIRALLVQSDGGLGVSSGAGSILVGGQFSVFNSVGNHYFTRLNVDGSLDTSFNLGAGADNPVYALGETFAVFGTNAVRKLLLGGSFTTVNGTARSCIAQLNDDGTVDTTFNPGLGANGTVYAIKVYSTNDINSRKILIGGDFTTVNGVPRNHIARLNPDGSLDTSFDPQAGPDNSVRSIDLQADGSVIIGGLFTSVNGSALSHIARLAPNGSVDPAFTPGVGADDVVFSVVVQEDQKIMLGGGFSHASGVTRGRITRLNSDGTVDPTINFGAGANDFVAAIVIQPDDMMIIGGGFTTYDGAAKPHLARIYGRTIVGQGALQFTAAEYQVNENGTNAVISVRRTGGTGDPNVGDATVTFQTSDDTGVAGVDYVSVITNLDFPVGETFATVTIPIIDNSIVDPDRLVDLTLLNANNALLGGQNTATLTIINDDSTVGFSLADYRVARNVGNGAAIISVVRSGSTIGTTKVDFLTTTNGTAKAGVDYLAVTNTVTFTEGVSTQTVAVPIINTNLPGGITVDLVLTNGSNTFLLGQDEATLTILDNSLSPGNVKFLPAGYVVNETGTNAMITILRTNGNIGQISVLLTAGGGGSAVPGVDYTPTNGTVVFGDGETSKTFLVPVFYDPQITGPLTVNLALSNPTGGAGIAGSSTSLLTIQDVDVGVAFSQPGYFVNETSGSLTITVNRVGGTNTPFDVHYASTNATALAGSNYGAVSGSLHFSAGQTFQTFAVPILHNPQVQGNLIFFIGLSLSNSPARLGNPSTASVTVIDTDSGLAFLSPTNSVSKAGTNAIITVLRTGSTVGTVSANFATSDGTAVSGIRYIGTNGVLTFLDGQVTNSFSVAIINDNAVDGDQTVNLSLSHPTGGAQLLAPSNSVLTIVDTTVGLSFSSPTYTVNENGVSATITVLRTGVTNSTVSVDFTTSDGTATAGNQYVTNSGTLTFTNGVVSQTFTVTIIDKNVTGGSETVGLTLANPSSPGILVNPSAATLTILNNDGSAIVPSGTTLLSESGPVNGIIDPGETASLLFGFRNSGGTNTVNLTATLLATNGITSPSGQQTYGVLVVGGPTVSRPFTFTASGTNGSRIAATFKLQDGAFTTTNSFSFTLGHSATSFTNTNSITIVDFAPASPYPATNVVSGLDGVINKVTVSVSNLAHTSLSDVVLLLVGPTGQKEVLMNDVAFHLSVTNLSLTFDDAAVNSLPASSVPTNGTYKPTVLAAAPNFPAPAPAGPYTSSLSDFIGTNPNGNWLLYVLDDVGGDSGAIVKGWSLTINSTAPVQPSADLAVGLTAPATPVVTSNFTYTISVTNFGPAGATNAQAIDVLPAGFTYVSATAPGGVVNNAGTVTLSLGTLATNSTATATVTVNSTNVGLFTNSVSVAANQTDANPGNNTASLVTSISGASADLAVGMSGAPDPVTLSGNVTYTITITNLGLSAAVNVVVSNTLPASLKPVSAPGGSTNVPGVVIWNLGSLANGATASFTLVAHTTAAGTFTNVVNVSSAVLDPFKGNNQATVKTEVDALQLGSSRGPNTLVFTWPLGYDLYSASSLTPPVVWTKVTVPAPQVVNGTNTVTISTATGRQFFQVRSGP